MHTLQWRHNERDGVSNHQPRDCLLNRLFRHRWKITSKLRVTGHWKGNSRVTGEFPAQRASNAENVSIWWRHHVSLGHHSSKDRVYGEKGYSLIAIREMKIKQIGILMRWSILTINIYQHNKEKVLHNFAVEAEITVNDIWLNQRHVLNN